MENLTYRRESYNLATSTITKRSPERTP